MYPIISHFKKYANAAAMAIYGDYVHKYLLRV